MQAKFLIKAVLTTGIFLSTSVATVKSAEGGDESAISGQQLLDEQNKKLEQIAIDMNKSGKKLYDTFTSEPQNVAESGCLDKIRGISADVIVIDPANLLGAVYSALKDEIVSQACSAATEYANKLSEILELNLELPYGIASIEIGAGDNATGGGGAFQPDVKLDNEKVAEDVKKTVLEKARNRQYKASDNVRFSETEKRFKNTKSKSTKDAEKQLENIVDVDKIWGGKDEGGNND